MVPELPKLDVETVEKLAGEAGFETIGSPPGLCCCTGGPPNSWDNRSNKNLASRSKRA